MADFNINKGDRVPPIEAQLSIGDNVAVLTGATVQLRYRPKGGGTVLTKDATITDAIKGEVKYEWAAGDTDTAGVFDARWRVTYADGRRATFPNQKPFEIAITEDL